MLLRFVTDAELREVIEVSDALRPASPVDDAEVYTAATVARIRSRSGSLGTRRLLHAIERLSSDARHEVLAHAWHGRHSEQATFEEFLEEPRARANENDVDYLTGMGSALAGYG